MNEFTKVNIIEYLKNTYEPSDYKIARKIGKVKAREGVVGEKIATILKSGLIETYNSVHNDIYLDKNDMVITNPTSEEYVISYKNFLKSYKKLKGNTYVPKKNLKIIVELKNNVTFMAPWQELMKIKKGGFLVINNQDDIYGIAKEEFEETYIILKD